MNISNAKKGHTATRNWLVYFLFSNTLNHRVYCLAFLSFLFVFNQMNFFPSNEPASFRAHASHVKKNSRKMSHFNFSATKQIQHISFRTKQAVGRQKRAHEIQFTKRTSKWNELHNAFLFLFRLFMFKSKRIGPLVAFIQILASSQN